MVGVVECVTDLKLGHRLMRADEIPVVGYNSLWCACVYSVRVQICE